MRLLALVSAAILFACASAPPVAKGRAAAWGYVRLVPREGVATGSAGGSYGDREVADAELVDYTKPGFAVVWVEATPPGGSATRIAIRDGVAGVRFEPAHAALAAGGTITIVNESARPHLLSVPAAGLVRPLATGDSAPIANAAAGEWSLFLLDVPGEEARVFAAPGPFQVVSTSGRFALGDLAPGVAELHAWHPRFPPASRAISLAADTPTRVDLELRVGRASEESVDAR
jgi:hypothetical protein